MGQRYSLPRKLLPSARLRGGATVEAGEARHPGRATWGQFPISISAGQKAAPAVVKLQAQLKEDHGFVGFVL